MWMPTHVQLTVQRAKGLLVKGKHGTNDCFVVMSLGKEKYQTSVKEKSPPNVEWCEECELTIPKQGNTAEIKLTVLHRNFLGVDEFLGQTSIPLSDFDHYERPRNRWYRLHSKPDKKDTKNRGELEVRLGFTVKAAPTASTADLSGAGEGQKTRGSLLSLPRVTANLGGSLASLGSKKKSLKKLVTSAGHKVAKVGRRRGSRGAGSEAGSEAGSDLGDLGWDDAASSNADPGVISEGEEDGFGFDDIPGRRGRPPSTPDLHSRIVSRGHVDETPLSSLSSSIQSGLSDSPHAAISEPLTEATVRQETAPVPSPLAISDLAADGSARSARGVSARSSGRLRPAGETVPGLQTQQADAHPFEEPPAEQNPFEEEEEPAGRRPVTAARPEATADKSEWAEEIAQRSASQVDLRGSGKRLSETAAPGNVLPGLASKKEGDSHESYEERPQKSDQKAEPEPAPREMPGKLREAARADNEAPQPSARGVSARSSARLRPPDETGGQVTPGQGQPQGSAGRTVIQIAESPEPPVPAPRRADANPFTAGTPTPPAEEAPNPFDEPGNPFDEPAPYPFEECGPNPFDEAGPNPFDEPGPNPFDDDDEMAGLQPTVAARSEEARSHRADARSPKQRKRDKLGKMFRNLGAKKDDDHSDAREKKHKEAYGKDGGEAGQVAAGPGPDTSPVDGVPELPAAKDKSLKDRFRKRDKQEKAAPPGRKAPQISRNSSLNKDERHGDPVEKVRRQGSMTRSDSVPLLRMSDWPGSRVVEGGNDHQTEAVREAMRPYEGLSRERLVELITGLQREVRHATEELKKSRAQTLDLEEYVDSLLVRVIETNPELLQSPCRPAPSGGGTGGAAKYVTRPS